MVSCSICAGECAAALLVQLLVHAVLGIRMYNAGVAVVVQQLLLVQKPFICARKRSVTSIDSTSEFQAAFRTFQIAELPIEIHPNVPFAHPKRENRKFPCADTTFVVSQLFGNSCDR